MGEIKGIMNVNVGIDIGSTTVKIVVVRDGEIIHKHYERHFSKVREKAVELVRAARELIGEDTPLRCSITGSAGLGVAKAADIDFVQEVFATRKAVGVHVPQADVVIELGGEDAKIVFLTGQLEERMNGSCAGGTGAFIDQMAVLLDVTPSELDELSQGAERIYTIASRCGVFAKSDIQPLLNEGARKEDVAASIFQAVVNQTIAGLAQGREVKGDVLFLGGPLFFFKGLQKRFQETLKLDDAHAHFPGSRAVCHRGGRSRVRRRHAEDLRRSIRCSRRSKRRRTLRSLPTTCRRCSRTRQQYEAFTAPSRHARCHDAERYHVRGRRISRHRLRLHHHQAGAHRCGRPDFVPPLPVQQGQSGGRYPRAAHQDCTSCAATAYISWPRRSLATARRSSRMPSACDFGLVETVAHFRAARHFCPDVDFIIDIGGQDIKCFKIRNNVHRQYFAQRGVLVRLRLVHRDVRPARWATPSRNSASWVCSPSTRLIWVRAARCS